MKHKSFIPSPKRYINDKKPTDYWGILFISFILLSSVSCFLFANHGDRQSTNNLSLNTLQISSKVIDLDQSNII